MSRPGRDVPWPTLGCAVAVAVVIGATKILLRPEEIPPLVLRMAQLTLAGGAAYLLDDAATALTGVVPRSLRRRRAARLMVGAIFLGTSWAVVLAALSDVRGTHVAVLTGETLTLVLISLAVSAVLISRGEGEPGALVAPAVVLAGLGLVLSGALLGIDVFPSGAAPGSRGATVLAVVWWAAAVLALAVLVLSSRDPARRVPKRLPLI